MGKLILIWISLPFIIKAFLFIIILYLYLMLCMQLYTRTETIANRIRKWRYKRVAEQYLELIERSLEQIETGALTGKSDLVGTELQEPDLMNFISILKKRKNSYLLDLWIYYGVLKIRAIAGSTNSKEEKPVSYTHLRAHETRHDLVCRLLLEKKKKKKK